MRGSVRPCGCEQMFLCAPHTHHHHIKWIKKYLFHSFSQNCSQWKCKRYHLMKEKDTITKCLFCYFDLFLLQYCFNWLNYRFQCRPRPRRRKLVKNSKRCQPVAKKSWLVFVFVVWLPSKKGIWNYLVFFLSFLIIIFVHIQFNWNGWTGSETC